MRERLKLGSGRKGCGPFGYARNGTRGSPSAFERSRSGEQRLATASWTTRGTRSNRRGSNASNVKQRTAKNRLRRALHRVPQGCASHWHEPLLVAQQKAHAQKLHGHHGYLSITSSDAVRALAT